MYKPDDKDIDRLSRDAAEHYRAPGEPSWDALQQILNHELPLKEEKKRRGFFFFFFLLLGISVAGAGVWYGLHVNTSGKSTTIAGATNDDKAAALLNAPSPATENKTAPGKNGTVTPPATVHPSEGSSAPVASQSASAVIAPAGKQDVAGNTTDRKKATVNENKNVAAASNYQLKPTAAGNVLETGRRTKHQQNTVGNKSALQTSNNQRNDIVTTTRNKNKHRPGKKENANQPSTAGEAVTPDEPAAASTESETVVAPPPKNNQPAITSTDTSAMAALPATTNAPVVARPASAKKDSAAAAKKKNPSPPARAINIGIVAGLDKSTVKFTHDDNVGYNIGIMGGYQFTKHWAAYTGVIYTKKNYTLNGNDYHPPKHYWTQYVQLETVDGYCHMWELPLQVRYTFNPASKTPFFASAGLSSYIMKKQGYTYYYKNNNMPYTTYWANDSTFNHVFSILHLSAGFEKRIGTRMNLQIEPYAKIPLGGVGFGNIRLSSFGINFSVQYRQPVKR